MLDLTALTCYRSNMIQAHYVQHVGSDLTVVNSARVSYGKVSAEFTEQDIKLINYLAKNQHMTPFEHCVLTVLVECPLFVRSQIMRHRTFSYNEVSRRYTSEDIKFYIPGEFRKQDAKNKQSSIESKEIVHAEAHQKLMQAYVRSKNIYEELLALGVCREQARMVLPEGLFTKFYMTGNLRNFVHFLKLRLDSHAQEETRRVALDVQKIIEGIWPESYKALLAN